VVLPTALRAAADGQREVEAQGATLREVLDDLGKRLPTLERRVRDESGRVRPHVLIFVDGVNLHGPTDLDLAISTDSEVFIAPAVSGG